MNPLLSHAFIGVASAILGLCVGLSIRDSPRVNSQLLLNICVVVFSILALTTLFVSINKYRDATVCQSNYNINFTRALVERGKAGDDDRHATRVMVDEILKPTATPADKLKAVENWRKSLQAADDKRDVNPIPITPECAKDIQ